MVDDDAGYVPCRVGMADPPGARAYLRHGAEHASGLQGGRLASYVEEHRRYVARYPDFIAFIHLML